MPQEDRLLQGHGWLKKVAKDNGGDQGTTIFNTVPESCIPGMLIQGAAWHQLLFDHLASQLSGKFTCIVLRRWFMGPKPFPKVVAQKRAMAC